jgi:hypothetical protein
MNRPLLASLALLLIPVLGCEPEPYCLNCATGDGGLVNVRDVAPIRDNGIVPVDTGVCLPSGMEVCDRRDNDCDGMTDEGFDLTADPRNCGACGNACAPAHAIPACAMSVCGYRQCDVGFVDLDRMPGNGCEYECSVTGAEVCDGIDNDCDGMTDEGFDLTSSAVNCGRCGNACVFDRAEAACVASVCRMGACRPGAVDRDHNPANGCEYECTTSGPEVCDGRDNDCDGTTDNGFSLMTDVANCGACGRVCPAVNATASCVGGSCGVASCARGFVDRNGDPTDGCELSCGDATGTRGPEVCDGRDNDCNGLVDDAPAMVGAACGPSMGVCRPGTYVCERGALRCVGGSAPGSEICNNLDDDCNGVVDDAPAGGVIPGTGPLAICGNNVGACTFGRFACVGGAIVCSGGTGTATEICDGQDNDCDGLIDEGLAPPASLRCNRRGAEGRGVCSAARPVCNGAAGWGCTYPTTYRDLDSEAYCDGLDNNCDARVDEGCQGLAPPTDVRLDSSVQNSIQPFLAGAGNNIGVVFIDRRSGESDVYFARTTDGGGSWLRDVRLDTNAAGSFASVQPRLAWPNGGAGLVSLWGDFRPPSGTRPTGYRQVFGNVSSASGGTWGAADFRINPGQDDDSFNIELVPTTRGYLAVWEVLFSNRGRHIFASTSTNGTVWSPPLQIDTGGGFASVASTPDLVAVGNRAYLVWRDNRAGEGTDIYFRASADGGLTWPGPEVRLDTDPAGTHASEEPSIAADAAGNVLVAWQDVRANDAYDIYSNRSTDFGATWRTSDARVDADPYPHDSIRPTTLSLPGGEFSVVWQEFRWGLPNVYASRTTAGAFPARDVQVMAGLPGQSRAFNVVASNAGLAVYAVWADDRNGSLDIYANYSLDGGGLFQPTDIRLDSAQPGVDSATPAVLATTNGANPVAHVVWVDRRAGINGDIYYRSIR